MHELAKLAIGLVAALVEFAQEAAQGTRMIQDLAALLRREQGPIDKPRVTAAFHKGHGEDIAVGIVTEEAARFQTGGRAADAVIELQSFRLQPCQIRVAIDVVLDDAALSVIQDAPPNSAVLVALDEMDLLEFQVEGISILVQPFLHVCAVAHACP